MEFYLHANGKDADRNEAKKQLLKDYHTNDFTALVTFQK